MSTAMTEDWRRDPTPYEVGNEAAVKHGADSARRWKPIAARLTDELLAERPWLAQHRRTVAAWARVAAQAELIGDYLDREGLLDEAGEPRKCSERLDRLESRAQSLRNDLAEPPLAMARLLGTLSATAVATGSVDALEALKAEGRALVAAWEQRAAGELLEASGAAERSEEAS